MPKARSAAHGKADAPSLSPHPGRTTNLGSQIAGLVSTSGTMLQHQVYDSHGKMQVTEWW